MTINFTQQPVIATIYYFALRDGKYTQFAPLGSGTANTFIYKGYANTKMPTYPATSAQLYPEVSGYDFVWVTAGNVTSDNPMNVATDTPLDDAGTDYTLEANTVSTKILSADSRKNNVFVIYAAQPQKAVIKYVDQTGAPVAVPAGTPTSLTGVTGEAYDTTKLTPDVPGYSNPVITDTAQVAGKVDSGKTDEAGHTIWTPQAVTVANSGVFGSNNSTVITVTYQAAAQVANVRYVDQNGNPVVGMPADLPTTLTGTSNSPLANLVTATMKTAPAGYTYDSTDSATTFDADTTFDQTVTVHFIAANQSATVRYVLATVDADGKVTYTKTAVPGTTPVSLSGTTGADYASNGLYTSAVTNKAIPGYTRLGIDLGTGKFVDGTNTITVGYVADEATLQVIYYLLDTDNKDNSYQMSTRNGALMTPDVPALTADKLANLHTDDVITLTDPMFKGYVLQKADTDLSGLAGGANGQYTVKAGTNSISYYFLATTQKATVNFVDEDGKQIPGQASRQVTGPSNSPIQVENEIPGWTKIDTDANYFDDEDAVDQVINIRYAQDAQEQAILVTYPKAVGKSDITKPVVTQNSKTGETFPAFKLTEYEIPGYTMLVDGKAATEIAAETADATNNPVGGTPIAPLSSPDGKTYASDVDGDQQVHIITYKANPATLTTHYYLEGAKGEKTGTMAVPGLKLVVNTNLTTDAAVTITDPTAPAGYTLVTDDSDLLGVNKLADGSYTALMGDNTITYWFTADAQVAKVTYKTDNGTTVKAASRADGTAITEVDGVTDESYKTIDDYKNVVSYVPKGYTLQSVVVNGQTYTSSAAALAALDKLSAVSADNAIVMNYKANLQKVVVNFVVNQYDITNPAKLVSQYAMPDSDQMSITLTGTTGQTINYTQIAKYLKTETLPAGMKMYVYDAQNNPKPADQAATFDADDAVNQKVTLYYTGKTISYTFAILTTNDTNAFDANGKFVGVQQGYKDASGIVIPVGMGSTKTYATVIKNMGDFIQGTDSQKLVFVQSLAGGINPWASKMTVSGVVKNVFSGTTKDGRSVKIAQVGVYGQATGAAQVQIPLRDGTSISQSYGTGVVKNTDGSVKIVSTTNSSSITNFYVSLNADGTDPITGKKVAVGSTLTRTEVGWELYADGYIAGIRDSNDLSYPIMTAGGSNYTSDAGPWVFSYTTLPENVAGTDLNTASTVQQAISSTAPVYAVYYYLKDGIQSVDVNFLDQSGKVIHAAVTEIGKSNTKIAYTNSTKVANAIKGYQLVSDGRDATTTFDTVGVTPMTDSNNNVVYNTDGTVKLTTDANGNVIDTQRQTVNLVYKANVQSASVAFVGPDGKALKNNVNLPDGVTAGTVDFSAITAALKAIPGYHIVTDLPATATFDDSDNVNGADAEPQVFTIVYAKDAQTVHVNYMVQNTDGSLTKMAGKDVIAINGLTGDTVDYKSVDKVVKGYTLVTDETTNTTTFDKTNNGTATVDGTPQEVNLVYTANATKVTVVYRVQQMTTDGAGNAIPLLDGGKPVYKIVTPTVGAGMVSTSATGVYGDKYTVDTANEGMLKQGYTFQSVSFSDGTPDEVTENRGMVTTYPNGAGPNGVTAEGTTSMTYTFSDADDPTANRTAYVTYKPEQYTFDIVYYVLDPSADNPHGVLVRETGFAGGFYSYDSPTLPLPAYITNYVLVNSKGERVTDATGNPVFVSGNAVTTGAMGNAVTDKNWYSVTTAGNVDKDEPVTQLNKNIPGYVLQNADGTWTSTALTFDFDAGTIAVDANGNPKLDADGSVIYTSATPDGKLDVVPATWQAYKDYAQRIYDPYRQNQNEVNAAYNDEHAAEIANGTLTRKSDLEAWNLDNIEQTWVNLGWTPSNEYDAAQYNKDAEAYNTGKNKEQIDNGTLVPRNLVDAEATPIIHKFQPAVNYVTYQYKVDPTITYTYKDSAGKVINKGEPVVDADGNSYYSDRTPAVIHVTADMPADGGGAYTVTDTASDIAGFSRSDAGALTFNGNAYVASGVLPSTNYDVVFTAVPQKITTNYVSDTKNATAATDKMPATTTTVRDTNAMYTVDATGGATIPAGYYVSQITYNKAVVATADSATSGLHQGDAAFTSVDEVVKAVSELGTTANQIEYTLTAAPEPLQVTYSYTTAKVANWTAPKTTIAANVNDTVATDDAYNVALPTVAGYTAQIVAKAADGTVLNTYTATQFKAIAAAGLAMTADGAYYDVIYTPAVQNIKTLYTLPKNAKVQMTQMTADTVQAATDSTYDVTADGPLKALIPRGYQVATITINGQELSVDDADAQNLQVIAGDNTVVYNLKASIQPLTVNYGFANKMPNAAAVALLPGKSTGTNATQDIDKVSYAMGDNYTVIVPKIAGYVATVTTGDKDNQSTIDPTAPIQMVAGGATYNVVYTPEAQTQTTLYQGPEVALDRMSKTTFVNQTATDASFTVSANGPATDIPAGYKVEKVTLNDKDVQAGDFVTSVGGDTVIYTLVATDNPLNVNYQYDTIKGWTAPTTGLPTNIADEAVLTDAKYAVAVPDVAGYTASVVDANGNTYTLAQLANLPGMPAGGATYTVTYTPNAQRVNVVFKLNTTDGVDMNGRVAERIDGISNGTVSYDKITDLDVPGYAYQWQNTVATFDSDDNQDQTVYIIYTAKSDQKAKLVFVNDPKQQVDIDTTNGTTNTQITFVNPTTKQTLTDQDLVRTGYTYVLAGTSNAYASLVNLPKYTDADDDTQTYDVTYTAKKQQIGIVQSGLPTSLMTANNLAKIAGYTNGHYGQELDGTSNNTLPTATQLHVPGYAFQAYLVHADGTKTAVDLTALGDQVFNLLPGTIDDNGLAVTQVEVDYTPTLQQAIVQDATHNFETATGQTGAKIVLQTTDAALAKAGYTYTVNGFSSLTDAVAAMATYDNTDNAADATVDGTPQLFNVVYTANNQSIPVKVVGLPAAKVPNLANLTGVTDSTYNNVPTDVQLKVPGYAYVITDSNNKAVTLDQLKTATFQMNGEQLAVTDYTVTYTAEPTSAKVIYRYDSSATLENAPKLPATTVISGVTDGAYPATTIQTLPGYTTVVVAQSAQVTGQYDAATNQINGTFTADDMSGDNSVYVVTYVPTDHDIKVHYAVVDEPSDATEPSGTFTLPADTKISIKTDKGYQITSVATPGYEIEKIDDKVIDWDKLAKVTETAEDGTIITYYKLDDHTLISSDKLNVTFTNTAAVDATGELQTSHYDITLLPTKQDFDVTYEWADAATQDAANATVKAKIDAQVASPVAKTGIYTDHKYGFSYVVVPGYTATVSGVAHVDDKTDSDLAGAFEDDGKGNVTANMHAVNTSYKVVYSANKQHIDVVYHVADTGMTDVLAVTGLPTDDSGIVTGSLEGQTDMAYTDETSGDFNYKLVKAVPGYTYTITDAAGHVVKDATVDGTTGDITFKTVDTPAVAGYTPDAETKQNVSAAIVDAETGAVSYAPFSSTVTYTADVQKVVVTFKDLTTGKAVSGQEPVMITGVTDGTIDFTTAQDVVKALEEAGYYVVAGLPKTDVPYDNDDAKNQAYEVTLRHSVTPQSEDLTATSTVTYEGANPAPATNVVTVTVNHTYQMDKVTNTRIQATAKDAYVMDYQPDTYTVAAEDAAKVTVDETTGALTYTTVKTPAVDGYTPDKTAVSNTAEAVLNTETGEYSYGPVATKAVYTIDAVQKASLHFVNDPSNRADKVISDGKAYETIDFGTTTADLHVPGYSDVITDATGKTYESIDNFVYTATETDSQDYTVTYTALPVEVAVHYDTTELTAEQKTTVNVKDGKITGVTDAKYATANGATTVPAVPGCTFTVTDATGNKVVSDSKDAYDLKNATGTFVVDGDGQPINNEFTVVYTPVDQTVTVNYNTTELNDTQKSQVKAPATATITGKTDALNETADGDTTVKAVPGYTFTVTNKAGDVLVKDAEKDFDLKKVPGQFAVDESGELKNPSYTVVYTSELQQQTVNVTFPASVGKPNVTTGDVVKESVTGVDFTDTDLAAKYSVDGYTMYVDGVKTTTIASEPTETTANGLSETDGTPQNHKVTYVANTDQKATLTFKNDPKHRMTIVESEGTSDETINCGTTTADLTVPGYDYVITDAAGNKYTSIDDFVYTAKEADSQDYTVTYTAKPVEVAVHYDTENLTAGQKTTVNATDGVITGKTDAGYATADGATTVKAVPGYTFTVTDAAKNTVVANSTSDYDLKEATGTFAVNAAGKPINGEFTVVYTPVAQSVAVDYDTDNLTPEQQKTVAATDGKLDGVTDAKYSTATGDKIVKAVPGYTFTITDASDKPVVSDATKPFDLTTVAGAFALNTDGKLVNDHFKVVYTPVGQTVAVNYNTTELNDTQKSQVKAPTTAAITGKTDALNGTADGATTVKSVPGYTFTVTNNAGDVVKDSEKDFDLKKVPGQFAVNSDGTLKNPSYTVVYTPELQQQTVNVTFPASAGKPNVTGEVVNKSVTGDNFTVTDLSSYNVDGYTMLVDGKPATSIAAEATDTTANGLNKTDSEPQLHEVTFEAKADQKATLTFKNDPKHRDMISKDNGVSDTTIDFGTTTAKLHVPGYSYVITDVDGKTYESIDDFVYTAKEADSQDYTVTYTALPVEVAVHYDTNNLTDGQKATVKTIDGKITGVTDAKYATANGATTVPAVPGYTFTIKDASGKSVVSDATKPFDLTTVTGTFAVNEAGQPINDHFTVVYTPVAQKVAVDYDTANLTPAQQATVDVQDGQLDGVTDATYDTATGDKIVKAVPGYTFTIKDASGKSVVSDATKSFDLTTVDGAFALNPAGKLVNDHFTVVYTPVKQTVAVDYDTSNLNETQTSQVKAPTTATITGKTDALNATAAGDTTVKAVPGYTFTVTDAAGKPVVENSDKNFDLTKVPGQFAVNANGSLKNPSYNVVYTPELQQQTVNVTFPASANRDNETGTVVNKSMTGQDFTVTDLSSYNVDGYTMLVDGTPATSIAVEATDTTANGLNKTDSKPQLHTVTFVANTDQKARLTFVNDPKQRDQITKNDGESDTTINFGTTTADLAVPGYSYVITDAADNTYKSIDDFVYTAKEADLQDYTVTYTAEPVTVAVHFDTTMLTKEQQATVNATDGEISGKTDADYTTAQGQTTVPAVPGYTFTVTNAAGKAVAQDATSDFDLTTVSGAFTVNPDGTPKNDHFTVVYTPVEQVVTVNTDTTGLNATQKTQVSVPATATITGKTDALNTTATGATTVTAVPGYTFTVTDATGHKIVEHSEANFDLTTVPGQFAVNPDGTLQNPSYTVVYTPEVQQQTVNVTFPTSANRANETGTVVNTTVTGQDFTATDLSNYNVDGYTMLVDGVKTPMINPEATDTTANGTSTTDSAPQVHNVTFVANTDQKATLTFVNDPNHRQPVVETTGTSDTTISFGMKTADLAVPGYSYVITDAAGKTYTSIDEFVYTAKEADSQDYTVTYTPAVQQQTVTVTFPKAAGRPNIVGQVTQTSTTGVDFATVDLTKYAVPGYTMLVDGRPATSIAPEATDTTPNGLATVDNAPQGHQVTFVANAAKAQIVVIDDTTGATLRVDDVQGVTDGEVVYNSPATIKRYEAMGYVLVSDGFIAGTHYDAIADATRDSQIFEIHLQHDTVDGTGKTRTIVRHTTIKTPDGKVVTV
ncbi:mucin-binding protein [Weissella cibaria]|uniref:mucin-binding protein n=1 Tax=Weissella cibaria TaxID=137591 RepID=UPI001FF19312|nr:hypothetical protein [Weissella cibaria]UOX37359.1 hypothetical protein IDM39_03420 [Weissella cibaria]